MLCKKKPYIEYVIKHGEINNFCEELSFILKE